MAYASPAGRNRRGSRSILFAYVDKRLVRASYVVLRDRHRIFAVLRLLAGINGTGFPAGVERRARCTCRVAGRGGRCWTAAGLVGLSGCWGRCRCRECRRKHTKRQYCSGCALQCDFHDVLPFDLLTAESERQIGRPILCVKRQSQCRRSCKKERITPLRAVYCVKNRGQEVYRVRRLNCCVAMRAVKTAG